MGIFILVRFLQYPNASAPILVTLFGISMLVRCSQYSNAPAPILVTPFGTIYDFSVFPNAYCINISLSLLNKLPSME